MEKGRILYVGGFQLPDGNAAAHRVLGIAKSLRDIGYTVVFLDVSDEIENRNLSSEWSCHGFSVFSQRHSHNNRQRIEYTYKPLHVEEVLEKHNDWNAVIAYNYPALALYRLKKLCHKRGLKIIADCTEWYGFCSKTLSEFLTFVDSEIRMRFVQKQLDGIIAISEYLGNYYKTHLPTIIVPPTVDLNEDKWHQVLEKQNDEIIMLTYAGSPGRSKDLLNQLVNAVFKTKKNVRLRIIGITRVDYLKIYEDTEARVKSLENQGRISFYGRLPHRETLKILQSSDYSIFFRDDNKVSRAGFPTKFVESISCGIPVITTDSSDLRKYVCGKNGLLLSRKEFESEFDQAMQTAVPSVEQECFMYSEYTYLIKRLINGLHKE